MQKKRRRKRMADGFAAERKLFRTRWIVGIPSAPLQLAPNSRIEVDLKQTQNVDSKPAIIKRVRLAISDDPRWTSFAARPRARAEHCPSAKSWNSSWQKSPVFRFPSWSSSRLLSKERPGNLSAGIFSPRSARTCAPDVPGIFPWTAGRSPAQPAHSRAVVLLTRTTAHCAGCGESVLGRALRDRNCRNDGKLRQRG